MTYISNETVMKEDQFNNILRNKLQDFEVPPAPNSWNAIVEKLPDAMPARTITPWYYAAAAVATLLIASSALTLLMNNKSVIPTSPVLTETIEIQSKEKKQSPTPTASKPLAQKEWVAVAKQQKAKAVQTANIEPAANSATPVAAAMPQQIASNSTTNNQPAAAARSTQSTRRYSNSRQQNSAIKKVAATSATQKARKWSFGMSGGNIGTGTSGSMNNYALRNTYKVDDRLMLMNNVASPMQSSTPKTDIKHHRPISFGLGIGRALNDRFSLQSGLVYSFMSSDWQTNGTYHAETNQKLHFIGIPLSISYKIAEWNKFVAYASAGGMGEINIAGKMKNTLFSETKEINTIRENTRMKELLWSLNARVGVSYPVIRFVNVFAEAGVDYYFDNGSIIETAHSEKPFSASFQVGFRFGI